MKEYIDITVSSLKRIDGPNDSVSGIASSCNFSTNLPEGIQLSNIKKCKLIGGSIPNYEYLSLNPQRHLYLDIDQFEKKRVYTNGLGHSVFAKLNYSYNTPNTSPFIKLKYNDYYYTARNLLGKKSTLKFSIYDQNGALYNFGPDVFSISSFTNANPTELTTTVNHNLINGDVVYISGFKNGSINFINNLINENGYSVTVTGLDTFTIPVDLSAELAQQPITGTVTYLLGSHASVVRSLTTMTGSVPIVSCSNANPTVVTTAYNHGIPNGTYVRIKDFDNGSTSLINQLMNSTYPITVTGLNTFTFPVDLSGELASQPLTGSSPPYDLGANSIITVEKRQVSFDLRFYYKDIMMQKATLEKK